MYSAIHKSPLMFLKYILREGKTNGNELVTGLCCSANVEDAYGEFERIYQKNSGERFYRKTNREVKNPIKVHHYIQSFAPGEVTPEQAHSIAVEWARKTFGDHRQVLISTHTDKGHVHSHIAVAVFDLNGQRWIGNKETLKKCREMSDMICKAHGLSIIDDPSKEHKHKYGEWKARKENRCWKDKLRDDIDDLILREDVKSVDDLIVRLREMNYTVNFGKYISVKAPKAKHSIRTFRLGDGYALEELKYRIASKDREMSFEKVMSYQGIQREYAVCLRQMQIIHYHHEPYIRKVSVREVRQNAELLQFLSENKIGTEEDFRSLVNENYEKCAGLKEQLEKVSKEAAKMKKLIDDIPEFLQIINSDDRSNEQKKRLAELSYLFALDVSSEKDSARFEEELKKLESKVDEVSRKLESAESDFKEVSGFYERYLDTIRMDYEKMLERAKREYAEAAERENREYEEYLRWEGSGRDSGRNRSR